MACFSSCYSTVADPKKIWIRRLGANSEQASVHASVLKKDSLTPLRDVHCRPGKADGERHHRRANEWNETFGHTYKQQQVFFLILGKHGKACCLIESFHLGRSRWQ